MPELPEVHTTATMLDRLVKGRKILDVWTDYGGDYFKGRKNIKDKKYFEYLRKEIKNKKILRVWRRAKNVLIDTEGDKTILIHMKMTGHLLFGEYTKQKQAPNSKSQTRLVGRQVLNEKERWTPKFSKGPLGESFNRFIHLVFTLSGEKNLALSDMRKFATVSLISDKEAFKKYEQKIGPEPLEKSFKLKDMKERLNLRANGQIKTILMDQKIISGIGNIYSDEILWEAGVSPERRVKSLLAGKAGLESLELKKIFIAMKKLLKKGIDFGGDSMSDYRNPLGERGKFQLHHKAYRRVGQKCLKKGCKGIIIRKIIGQRSAHFCSVHQK